MSFVRWPVRRDAARPLALVVAFAGFAISAQASELDPFVGRDLWKDRVTQSDLLRLDRMIGPVPSGERSKPRPWHVWKTDHNGTARYIVLLGADEQGVPGGSSACVALFDAALRRINIRCFQTGWRTLLRSADFEYSDRLASDLIVLHTGRVINGRDVANEYFAVEGSRLRFIRMEDATGKVVQNEYVIPNFEIGIVPPGNAEDQWVGMLRSTDKAATLAALVFLGGRHIKEPDRDVVPEPAESRYGVLFRRLVGSPRIHRLIMDLTRSDDEWIGQAALLAARGPRARQFQ